MAEQSHKREMMDAVRGDFERLRKRRERGEPPPAQPDKIVLTPAQPPAPEPQGGQPVAAEITPEPDSHRSWRWVRRRRS